MRPLGRGVSRGFPFAVRFAGGTRDPTRRGGIELEDFSAAHDPSRRGEHRLPIAVFAIDRHIADRVVGEGPLVAQAEQSRGGRTGHDRDFVQRVFTVDAAQIAGRGGLRFDFGQGGLAEGTVAEQADQVRIGGERAAVGMIGRQEDSRRVVDHQEQLQADRPLQRVDELPIAIAERDRPAPRFAFDIDQGRLPWPGEAEVGVLVHRIAADGDRLTEHHLADIDRDVGMLTQRGDQFGRGGGEGLAIPAAVTVELGVGEVDREAIGGADRGQRAGDVARYPEVAAVDMQRMGQADRMHRFGQTANDLARGHAVARMGRVDVELAGIEFEGIDATRVDDFDADRLRGGDHEGDIVVDLRLRRPFGDQFEQEAIIPQQHVGSRIEVRRIGHLGVRLSRVAGQHRRFDGDGVPHPQVGVAGGAGRRQEGVTRRLGHQHPGQRHLAAADVGVQVDPAGHDHVVVAIERAIGDRFPVQAFVGVPRGRDAAVEDVQITSHAARKSGSGVAQSSSGQANQRHGGNSRVGSVQIN